MRVNSLITSLGLVLFAAQLSSAKEWKGIVPLFSTRAEVEQIDLSSFKKVRGSACTPQEFYYVNDEEGFSIEFIDSGDKRETVFGYDYYPTAEQGRLFHCPA